MTAHRNLPKPDHWNRGNGFCRWCGEETTEPEPRRKRWHEACLREYNVTCGGNPTTNAVFERDKGVCACCGTDTTKVGLLASRGKYVIQIENMMVRGKVQRLFMHGLTGISAWVRPEGPYIETNFRMNAWEADHIHPLWLVDRDLPWEQLREYWGLGNLQTLCLDCHKAKSAREAAQRAKIKRIKKKQGKAAYQGATLPF